MSTTDRKNLTNMRILLSLLAGTKGLLVRLRLCCAMVMLILTVHGCDDPGSSNPPSSVSWSNPTRLGEITAHLGCFYRGDNMCVQFGSATVTSTDRYSHLSLPVFPIYS